jgi:toxin ParE1/3/4
MTGHRISAAAATDLDDIWFHIAADSLRNADRFLDRLVASVTGTLSAAPLAGRSRDEFEAGLRSLAFGHYLVFYRVQEEGIEIVRIIHGGRDVEAIFGE